MYQNKKKIFLNDFAKGALSGVTQTILTSVLTFFSVPIFINNLGAEHYGLYVLISVLGNLNVFAGLSLNASLLKSLSEQGKSKESDSEILVTVSLLLFFCAVFLLVTLGLKAEILEHVLNIPAEKLPLVSTLYDLLLIANALIIIGQAFTAILDSIQKIYLTNSLQFLYSVIFWGGSILVVHWGYGLTYIGWVSIIAAFIWLSLIVIVSVAQWGRLDSSNFKESFVVLAKKQLRYGANVYFSGLISFLFEPLSKIMVSHYFGVSNVGILEIAYKVKNILWTLISKVVYPLYPQIAKESDLSKIRKLMRMSERTMLYFLIPLLISIVFCMNDFVKLWIGGKDTGIITTAIITIVVTHLSGSLVIPIYYFLLLKNQVAKTIILNGAAVLVNTSILLCLHHIGFVSVLYANGIAVIIPVCLCFYYRWKYIFEEAPIKYGSRNIKYFVVACSTIFITYFIKQVLPENLFVRLLIIPTSIFLGAFVQLEICKLGVVSQYLINRKTNYADGNYKENNY